jgi:hypothetical protein
MSTLAGIRTIGDRWQALLVKQSQQTVAIVSASRSNDLISLLFLLGFLDFGPEVDSESQGHDEEGDKVLHPSPR